MVLIISEEADYSTNVVIDWLLFYNQKFVRINLEDNLVIDFIGEDLIFSNEKINFSLSDIKSVWYRRGDLPFKINKIGEEHLDVFRIREANKIKEFIHYKLTKIRHINNFYRVDYNKLIVSDIAREVGLLTPIDLLYNKKNSLIDKIKSSDIDYSTKSISGNFILQYDNSLLIGYTSLLKEENKISDTFFPSLIQDYITKKIELRVFYLNEIMWTMAIYSQSDTKTNTDFRNYNFNKPNRNVPFNLPFKIQKKIIALMKKLKLNCGSLDLILNNENEFYFLEVNPVGQFGMVSNPCNYYLHKEIAKYLCFIKDE